jgi:hypothetical protein
MAHTYVWMTSPFGIVPNLVVAERSWLPPHLILRQCFVPSSLPTLLLVSQYIWVLILLPVVAGACKWDDIATAVTATVATSFASPFHFASAGNARFDVG